MYKAREIASFYIQLLNSIPDNYIDNLKLNKLLYYSQAWSLVKFSKPLFEDEIQAWDLGPVIPDVYHIYKCCGKNPIIEPEETFAESNLSSEEVELLIDVYRTYGKYTGWALKEMTHRPGGPWAQVYQKGMNRTISQESIKAYYAGETLDSFDLDKLNIPVITEVPAEWDTPEDSVYD
mgnify:FL=1